MLAAIAVLLVCCQTPDVGGDRADERPAAAESTTAQDPTKPAAPPPRPPLERADDDPDPRDLDAEDLLVLDDRWPTVEHAARRGLAWLAEQQTEAGYWRGHVGHKRGIDYVLLRSVRANDAVGQGHMGVTALAGLAFLADGHIPGRGPYGAVVRRTLDYVVAHVEGSGLIRDGGTRMYSHAFATLFLAQVYGMSGDDTTRAALEKAVNLIVDCQNELGGWRYNPFSVQADLSVTVCQLQALRAANNIGIRVPRRTIEDAVEYVRRSQVRRGRAAGLYYYKIAGPGAYRKNREYAVNAAALTSLYSAGVRDAALHERALRFLGDSYPYLAQSFGDHYFYWYGNYYASQAFFQAGGAEFTDYWQRASRDLLQMQAEDGRWINRVGPGDTFATSVACVILLIPKQYLPIFQR